MMEILLPLTFAYLVLTGEIDAWLVVILPLAVFSGVILAYASGSWSHRPRRSTTETTIEASRRIKQSAADAEAEMQAVFFEGYSEMIEEARQARIDRLLKERGLQ